MSRHSAKNPLETAGKCLVLAGGIGLLVSLSLSLKQPEASAPLFQHSLLSASSVSQRVSCKVLSVFDGDTIACDLNGNGTVEKPGEYIRFLGIDTPEMHYSKKNKLGQDEPGAKAASEFVTDALLGKTVYLEWDVHRFDRYGRSLAFVFPGPHGSGSINQQLLEKGYATTFFIPPNEKYRQSLEAVEQQAKEAGTGIWGKNP